MRPKAPPITPMKRDSSRNAARMLTLPKPSARSAAEEEFPDFGVGEDPVRQVREAVLARLEDVSAVRELERLPGVLLDEHDRRAPLVDCRDLA